MSIPLPRRSVVFDMPVPAGHVRFPIEWEGMHFWCTGTPAAIKAAAELILAGLPTAREANIDMTDIDGQATCAQIGLGDDRGEDFLVGDQRVLLALRGAVVRNLAKAA